MVTQEKKININVNIHLGVTGIAFGDGVTGAPPAGDGVTGRGNVGLCGFYFILFLFLFFSQINFRHNPHIQTQAIQSTKKGNKNTIEKKLC